MLFIICRTKAFARKFLVRLISNFICEGLYFFRCFKHENFSNSNIRIYENWVRTQWTKRHCDVAPQKSTILKDFHRQCLHTCTLSYVWLSRIPSRFPFILSTEQSLNNKWLRRYLDNKFIRE